MAMRIFRYIGMAALLAAVFSCSIKDEETEMDGPVRVVISGHVLDESDGAPIGGALVEMVKIPLSSGSGSTFLAPAQPQTVVTSVEGYYSFESSLDGETARFVVSSAAASRDITVSRGDQSYDSKRHCYVIDMVDLYR